MTPEDRDLAIRTMLAETSTPEGRGAVAEVILNRLASGRWGRSLRDVVLAKNQFEPWNPGSGNDPRRFSPNSPEYQEAAMIFDATVRGDLPKLTNGATHFYAPVAQKALGRNDPAWATTPTTPLRIGGHQFYAPEGKVNYDPSSFDEISRSPSPMGVTQPKPVEGLLPTPKPAVSGGTQPDNLYAGASAPKPPSGNLLGRMMGGNGSGTPQSWADVFAGAGPGNPLLFRALSYGMQPSPAGSGGPAANASGGPTSASPPAPPLPAAGTPPMELPTAAPSGAAVGGNSSPQMPGLLGMLQNAFGGGATPAPAMPAAGAAAGGGNFLSMLGSIFKGI